jgi:hypothetical protein
LDHFLVCAHPRYLYHSASILVQMLAASACIGNGFGFRIISEPPPPLPTPPHPHPSPTILVLWFCLWSCLFLVSHGQMVRHVITVILHSCTVHYRCNEIMHQLMSLRFLTAYLLPLPLPFLLPLPLGSPHPCSWASRLSARFSTSSLRQQVLFLFLSGFGPIG